MSENEQQLRSANQKLEAANQQLRAERDRAQEYLDLASTVFIVIDKKGEVTHLNQKGGDILGYEPDEVIGKNWFDHFLPKAIMTQVRAVFDKLMASEIEPTEYLENTIVTKDKRERIIAWHNTTLRDDDGNIVAILSSGQDITDHKLAEAALKEDEKRLRILFDSAPDGYYLTDLKGTLIDGNKAAEQIAGYKKEELIGKNLLQLGLLHKRQLPSAIASLAKNAMGKPTGPDAFTLTRKDGSEIHVEITTRPVLIAGHTRVLAIARDISARKKTEEDLRASEEFKNQVIESSRDCIKVLDLDGRLLSMSRGGQELLEIADIKPYLGLNWIDFWKGTDREHALAAVEAAKHGNTVQFEGYCETEKGKPMWWEIVVTPIRDKEDRVGNILAVSRSCTERKRAEEQRHALEMQLRQSQKLEAIGTLAGGVAHEINNPVMGIMNYSQLILDELGPDSPVAEFATEIGKESERVAMIVTNLLSFARHDKQSHSPARMCDIVESVLSLIRTVMRHDQIALEVDVPEDLPALNCRSQQIQQVVMNLLTNARDSLNQKYKGPDANKTIIVSAQLLIATAKGKPDIHPANGGTPPPAGQARHSSRQRRDATRSSRLRLTVEDHGTGITEEVRQRMFDPFFTTKPRDEGTGLGLSISHGIVRDHGGEIAMESKVGEWTRLHVDLPISDKGPRRRRGK